MKRLSLYILIGLILGMALPCFAEVSEPKTADAQIVTGRGYFLGIILLTDATNAVTLNVYDSRSGATGKRLIPTDTVITTSSGNRIQAIGFNTGDVPFLNGLYIDITCAGTVTYTVYYERVR